MTVNLAAHERRDAINFHNSKIVWTLVALLATFNAEVFEIAAGLVVLLIEKIIHFVQSHAAGRPAPSIGGKSGHVN